MDSYAEKERKRQLWRNWNKKYQQKRKVNQYIMNVCVRYLQYN